MRRVRVGRADVAYHVAGDGPGLVLVHGTGGSAQTTWSHLLHYFTPHWTVVSPDLAGSGETTDDGGPLELEELAAQVAATAADASLERYSLVGFSLGAAVAAQLAVTEPDRVDALVMAAVARSGTHARSKLQFELWQDLHEHDPTLLARLWLLTGFSPGYLTAIPPDQVRRAAVFPIEPGMPRQCDLYTHIDLTEVLPAIRARTHVVGCTHDWIVPPTDARAVADAVAHSSYSQLDAGHMVVFEAGDEFARDVTEFLRSPGIRGF
jgi:3-oxoadipate enol-lactonase